MCAGIRFLNSSQPSRSRRGFLGRSLALGAGAWLAGASGSDLSASPMPHSPRSLREKVGQLFVVSFRGTSLQPAFETLLTGRHLGGAILFARNCTSATQVRT